MDYKLTEKNTCSAKLTSECVKLQFCFENGACTKANASLHSRRGSMHPQRKRSRTQTQKAPWVAPRTETPTQHMQHSMYKTTTDRIQGSPQSTRPAFGGRTSPQPLQRPPGTDVPSRPQYSRNAPCPTSRAPTGAHAQAPAVARQSTMPPKHPAAIARALLPVSLDLHPQTVGLSGHKPATPRRTGQWHGPVTSNDTGAPTHKQNQSTVWVSPPYIRDSLMNPTD